MSKAMAGPIGIVAPGVAGADRVLTPEALATPGATMPIGPAIALDIRLL